MNKVFFNLRKWWDILKSEWKQVLLLISLIAFLGLAFGGIINIPVLNKIWGIFDPVAGIATFFITLAILWNQLRLGWENGLEKRLNVEYCTLSGTELQVLFLVKGAYLAGESDIRPWAQQLGQQITGTLQFDMNWDDDTPKKIMYDRREKKYVKNFYVTMYLTTNPLHTEKGKASIHDFIERKTYLKHSTIEGDLENLPIIWKRK